MDNNLNENTMNNIKNMVDKGDLSGAISQISPEMIENFSKMMNNNSNNKTSNNNQNKNQYNTQYNNNSSKNNTYNNNNFDFNKIDVNTIMKMKSVMEKMNNSNDPGTNLLYSLKPYLRESKQEKIDQYANLLNFSKVAEIFKNDSTFNNKN